MRVRDTNRSPGTGRTLDTFGVNEMYLSTRTVPETPPAPPSGLLATPASASQINLTLIDGSDDEYGFYVERHSGTAWVRIGSVGADATRYQDTRLPSSTTFRYRVLAYNGAGESQPSNAAEATTLRAISLTASAGKTKGVNYVDLRWRGTLGDSVVIRRNGESIATTPNGGAYTDVIGKKPKWDYVYQVCEVGTPVCSDEVVVDFGGH